MNEGAKKLIQAVDERVRQHLAKLSSDAVFQVESVNDDGTLNGYVLPDMENAIHNVVNQSKYEFSNGDLGLLYLIGNSPFKLFCNNKIQPKSRRRCKDGDGYRKHNQTVRRIVRKDYC